MRRVFLASHKADRLHAATLQVLERTGVEVQNEEAVDLFLKAGATKDQDGRILIPARLVDEAIEKARPRSKLALHDREGKKSISLKRGRTHFGPGGDARYNIDPETGVLRPSLLNDVTTNVGLVDALPGYGFAMSMALPSDVPQEKLYPTVFAEMVANTTKPVVATGVTMDDIVRIHKIAAIVAGGEEALKKKPFYLMYLDPISPLQMDAVSVGKLLFCAEKEVPILYAAGANCGATAPVTPEGGVVQGGAESLAGLVLATLKNERVSFIYGSNTSAMDMKSTIISYGDPIWFKTVAMYADMARHYDISSWGTAGSADSIAVDAQAAMEAYEGITFVLMAGASLAHDVGYLGHGEIYDPRMLVFCDMMIGRAKHLLRPADLSDEALAIDVIDEVARTHGFFAGHPHTAEHFRKSLWMAPTYLNRSRLVEARLDDLPHLLGNEVLRIAMSHSSKPLATDKAEEIGRFLQTL